MRYLIKISHIYSSTYPFGTTAVQVLVSTSTLQHSHLDRPRKKKKKKTPLNPSPPPVLLSPHPEINVLMNDWRFLDRVLNPSHRTRFVDTRSRQEASGNRHGILAHMVGQMSKHLVFSLAIYLANPRFRVPYFLPARSTVPAAPGQKCPNINC